MMLSISIIASEVAGALIAAHLYLLGLRNHDPVLLHGAYGILSSVGVVALSRRLEAGLMTAPLILPASFGVGW